MSAGGVPRALQSGEIETPALVVNRDLLRANIETMQTAVSARGPALRPHVKTHKCLEIAAMQRDAGARGLTVATLSEAEVFADAGFTDLLVAYPVLPRGAKVDRLRRVAAKADLALGVDNPAGAAAVAQASRGLDVRVVLEVDSGQHRTGTPPADVARLAEQCSALGLRVAGVFTHGGHSYQDPEAPARAAQDEAGALVQAHDELRGAGFDVTIVSAGSTPTSGAPRPAQVTEERPGVYVFYDRQQLALGTCSPEQPALAVAATVVSSGRGRFVIDAGSKALASDRPAWLPGHGQVKGPREGQVVTLSEHHGIVETSTSAPAVGEVVLVVPNHVCTVVNLFDEYVVTQAGEVVDRWRVAARGRNV